jgi:hypothetical protein
MAVHYHPLSWIQSTYTVQYLSYAVRPFSVPSACMAMSEYIVFTPPTYRNVLVSQGWALAMPRVDSLEYFSHDSALHM